MTALTSDRARTRSGKQLGVKYLVAGGADLFEGALISINTTGYAVAGSNTAGEEFVGVCVCRVDNVAGSDGDKEVTVDFGNLERDLAADAGLTAAAIGRTVFVLDDQTVCGAAVGTGGVKCGRLVSLDADAGTCAIITGEFAIADAA